MILWRGELAAELNRTTTAPGLHDAIEGVNLLDKTIVIDQSPIGRTPRSNPATYTGILRRFASFLLARPRLTLEATNLGALALMLRAVAVKIVRVMV